MPNHGRESDIANVLDIDGRAVLAVIEYSVGDVVQAANQAFASHNALLAVMDDVAAA